MSVPRPSFNLAAWSLVPFLLTSLLAPEGDPILEGEVVLDVLEDPVTGVEVLLLDDNGEVVERTLTDGEGRFAFTPPEPGEYAVQARHGQETSDPSGPVEVTEDGVEHSRDLRLVLPSEVSRMARECLESGGALEGDGSILVGRVMDHATGLPLTESRVLLQWDEDAAAEHPEGRAETMADEEGRFAFCDVPGGVPLTAWGQEMGRMSRPLEGVAAEPGQVTRAVLPVDLGIDQETQVRILGEDLPVEGEEERDGSFSGTLLDASGSPIATALIRLVEADVTTTTDSEGRFHFDGLAPGDYTVEVNHLGYEAPTREIAVIADAEVTLDLVVSPEVVELEAIEVRSRTALEERRRIAPARVSVAYGDEVREAAEQGADLTRLVNRFAGVRTSHVGRRPGEGPSVCVQSTRRMGQIEASRHVQEDPEHLDWCPGMIQLVLDGVRIPEPEYFLASLPLHEVESVEYLTPSEASQAYGLGVAEGGALVVWTRGRGPYAEGGRSP